MKTIYALLWLLPLMIVSQIKHRPVSDQKKGSNNEVNRQITTKKTDTVFVTAFQVNTKILKEGEHRYLVYFKKGLQAPRSDIWFWNRIISRDTYLDKDAIIINQIWENKDTVMHTVKSICDAKTMQSLYNESWWKGQGKSNYDFINKSAKVNDYLLNDNDTNEKRLKSWKAFKKSWEMYTLNWHLDLEVFPILPYKENTVFIIPFYDPGYAEPKKVTYTVVGSSQLNSYDNQVIDCWLLAHQSKMGKETFWISKKTHEVLKLEQEIAGGRMYRYKVKLAYSN